MNYFPAPGKLVKVLLDEYGEDRFFEDMHNGISVIEIADLLNINHTGRIYSWINSVPERRARFKAFRTAMADQLVDEAIDIADNIEVDNGFAPVVKAKERIGIRKWVAAAWDKEQYGRIQPSHLIQNLSIGTLHLEALKQPQLSDPIPLPPEEIVVEVETPPSEGWD